VIDDVATQDAIMLQRQRIIIFAKMLHHLMQYLSKSAKKLA